MSFFCPLYLTLSLFVSDFTFNLNDLGGLFSCWNFQLEPSLFTYHNFNVINSFTTKVYTRLTYFKTTKDWLIFRRSIKDWLTLKRFFILKIKNNKNKPLPTASFFFNLPHHHHHNPRYQTQTNYYISDPIKTCRERW